MTKLVHYKVWIKPDEIEPLKMFEVFGFKGFDRKRRIPYFFPHRAYGMRPSQYDEDLDEGNLRFLKL